jgi:hypothetical protein
VNLVRVAAPTLNGKVVVVGSDDLIGIPTLLLDKQQAERWSKNDEVREAVTHDGLVPGPAVVSQFFMQSRKEGSLPDSRLGGTCLRNHYGHRIISRFGKVGYTGIADV